MKAEVSNGNKAGSEAIDHDQRLEVIQISQGESLFGLANDDYTGLLMMGGEGKGGNCDLNWLNAVTLVSKRGKQS